MTPVHLESKHLLASAAARALRWATLACAAWALSACGGGSDEPPAAVTTTLPNRIWTYLPDSSAYCGNGSSTGFAVNAAPESDTLLLYLQGGGACWDGFTCYGIDGSGGTASHFEDDMKEDSVLFEARDDERMKPLFDRTRADNPFANMTQVYVPYCTGDLHAGTKQTEHTFYLDKRPAFHTGASNLDAFLKQLVPHSPQVRRVVLMGASAGGYGAVFNWWRVRAAFGPNVRVDVLSDSGAPIDPVDDALWRTWRDAWSFSTPPGCAECNNTPTAWLPFYDQTVPAPARYGLINYMNDATLAQYGLISEGELSRRLATLKAAMGPRQKSYFLNGNDHVTIDQSPWPTNTSGVSMTTWIERFLSDDPTWDHSGP